MSDEYSGGSDERPTGAGWRHQLLEYIFTLAVAFALVFGFIKPAVADSYRIPTSSMEPTLHGCEGCNNDPVLANKFIYRFTEPRGGQIVVFGNVEGDDVRHIKRVVGLPGDRLRVRHGTLYVNGEPQDEPYVHANPCVRHMPKTCSFGPVRVPGDHYFLVGDNRSNSHDSRFFGAVRKRTWKGRPSCASGPPAESVCSSRPARPGNRGILPASRQPRGFSHF